ncbi:uncharacterized protein TM35_000061910 [Trypanosoma theileri]|uniref:Uncharacterized protein n=1 Tax=Trypanosoma theileri TaxID=67003 RepID=A0A1X0P2L9_9TRYP|nr:uncharacterized protein TM35_000061910 [Trypanosoma theileri]ORC91186.1 hypothetical protein TM35_000061910 [Trypanosoma theileri]
MEVKRDGLNLTALPSTDTNYSVNVSTRDKKRCESPSSAAVQQDAVNAVTNRQGLYQRPEWIASQCTGDGNKHQHCREFASVPTVECSERSSLAGPTRQMPGSFWRHRGDTSRFLPLRLRGGEKRQSRLNSTEASVSNICSQHQRGFSSDEWNSHRKSCHESESSFCCGEEEKDEVRLDGDSYTYETNSCAIIISLFQGVPRELLRSRYFHAWWRWVVQKRESKWNDTPLLTSSAAEKESPKVSTAPLTGLDSEYSPLHASSMTPPSNTPHCLAVSDSLDVSWQLTTGEASGILATGAPVSGVEEPESSKGTHSVVSREPRTRSQFRNVSAPSVPSDVFLERSGRRQSGQESSLSYASGYNQQTTHSRNDSWRENSVRSQEMVYACYFSLLEDEEEAARIVIEQKETGVRRKILSHAKHVLDEALMLALYGKRPVSLPMLLRVPSVENQTMEMMSPLSEEQPEFTSTDLRSTKSIPSIVCTRSPSIIQANDIQSREKQEPHNDNDKEKEKKQEKKRQPLVQEKLPTSDERNLQQCSTNLLVPLNAPLHPVEAKEKHKTPSEEKNTDNNHIEKTEPQVSLLEITRNLMISPSLPSPIPTGDASIRIYDDDNNNNNVDNKEKNGAKRNLNDSGYNTTEFSPSGSPLLRRFRYTELVERERERRCRIIVNYRKGLEQIIVVCFGGPTSTTSTTPTSTTSTTSTTPTSTTTTTPTSASPRDLPAVKTTDER